MWLQLEELPLDELNLVDCMYFFMNISNLAHNPGPRLAQRFTVRPRVCALPKHQKLAVDLGPRLAQCRMVRLWLAPCAHATF